MSDRTDEAKLVHFAGVLGLKFTRRPGGFCRWALPDGQTLVDGFGSAALPDFANDEAQMARVFKALRRAFDGQYGIQRDCMPKKSVAFDEWGQFRYRAWAQGHGTVLGRDEQSAAFALVLAVTGFEDD
ncbi:MAG: hypothetical protein GY722_24245 [bacterium]|nr:hypothetical protein [bacterium]